MSALIICPDCQGDGIQYGSLSCHRCCGTGYFPRELGLPRVIDPRKEPNLDRFF